MRHDFLNWIKCLEHHKKRVDKGNKNVDKKQKILIVDDSKPVFIKEDLLPVMGDNQMIQDLPSAFIRVLE